MTLLICTSCSAVYRAPKLLRPAVATSARLRRCVASVAAPPQSAAATTTLDVKAWLAERVGEALGEAFGAEYAGADPLITPATKPEFGDYQCNVAMGLGKRLKSKPRDVASSIVAALKVDECFEPTEIAGPGFLNLRLKPDFITAQLKLMLADADARLAIPPAPQVRCAQLHRAILRHAHALTSDASTLIQVGRVVVDYSSPNIAKEMHVGHLRSTIIGDTLARVLELRGHDVLRLNHVGDWGTQFGMLITQLRAEAPAAVSGEQRLDISELVALYKRAKAAFDESDDFKKTSREEVVKLQAGDAESVKAWRALCEQSEVAFQKVYDTLRVDERLETRGESFYNSKLGETVEALKEGSLLKESDGAQVVYAEDGSGAPIATNRDGDPMPMIVQKSDGGYMYSTTDLAAVRQRVTDEAAARVLYVTDAGQAQHFEQVFARSRTILPHHTPLHTGFTRSHHHSGVRHLEKGGLRSGRRQSRARAVRARAGRGRQEVQDAERRDGEARRPLGRGALAREGGRERAAGGRGARGRRRRPRVCRSRVARGGDRRGEVRRPVDEPDVELQVLVR